MINGLESDDLHISYVITQLCTKVAMALDIFLSEHVISFIKCHVRSVRKDDIIHQRHLRDGILKAQGTSILAIANPKYPIRRYKITNHSRVRGIQKWMNSDSYLTP